MALSLEDHMRWIQGCFFTVLVTGNIFAQSAAPAPHSSDEAQVVRVQMGYIAGGAAA
jgi:hypothetical protein